MQQGLPEQVAPYQLAAAGGTLQGVVKIAQLPRLRGLIYGQDTESAGRDQIAAKLLFSQDENGGCLLNGHISGVVMLLCQRCLGPMSWPFELELCLHLVTSESRAAMLPPEADVLVVEENLHLRELVEDEIILALPLVPKHQDIEECGVTVGEPSASVPEERVNPFSVLRNPKI